MNRSDVRKAVDYLHHIELLESYMKALDDVGNEIESVQLSISNRDGKFNIIMRSEIGFDDVREALFNLFNIELIETQNKLEKL